jgi:Fe-S-cluster containining protein
VSTRDDDAGGAEAQAEFDCQSCGACCAYSPQWPRFSLEDEAELALIPSHYVDDSQSGMRCQGARCSALIGIVGVSTRCAVYSVRPQVCRACLPHDDECLLARRELRI